MKRKNNFFKKQNSQDMLDVLFAQRFYYNRANVLEIINVILMLIICISNFFSIDNLIIKIIINVLFALICIALSKWISCDVKNGANLKKYFDYTLYNFELEQEFRKECLNLVHNVVSKNKKSYNQQISNDGKAKPPGLRDWYFDEKYNNELDIIKSMQKQNLDWDKIISKIYVLLLVVLFIVLMIFYFVIAFINNFKILELIVGIIPLFSIMGYLINKFIIYFSIDKNISLANYAINKATNKNDLIEVQKMIDERRKLNLIPPNLIHKLISKVIHERNEYVNSKK